MVISPARCPASLHLPLGGASCSRATSAISRTGSFCKAPQQKTLCGGYSSRNGRLTIAAQYDRQDDRRGTRSTRLVDERCASLLCSAGCIFCGTGCYKDASLQSPDAVNSTMAPLTRESCLTDERAHADTETEVSMTLHPPTTATGELSHPQRTALAATAAMEMATTMEVIPTAAGAWTISPRLS